MDKDKIELKVQEISKGMSYKGIYVLLLQEANGQRKMPIMIGHVESQMLISKLRPGQSIGSVLPDLFLKVTDAFHIHLEEIFIYKVEDGTFQAYLFYEHNGEIEHVGAKASDAVLMALTYGAPIYISRTLFERQYMKNVGEGAVSIPINSLNVELLQEALENAIREENYELASQLRDEINRRK